MKETWISVFCSCKLIWCCPCPLGSEPPSLSTGRKFSLLLKADTKDLVSCHCGHLGECAQTSAHMGTTRVPPAPVSMVASVLRVLSFTPHWGLRIPGRLRTPLGAPPAFPGGLDSFEEEQGAVPTALWTRHPLFLSISETLLHSSPLLQYPPPSGTPGINGISF